MDDLDPFSTKVADYYDSKGNRITIRDHSRPAPYVVPIMVIAAVVTIIGGIVWGAGAGILSTWNLVAHGKFTPNTIEAELWENRNNPNYYAERAKKAQVSVRITRWHGYDSGVFLMDVRIVNRSNREHSVTLKDTSVDISYDAGLGRLRTTVSINCSLGGGPSIDMPANSSRDIQCASSPTEDPYRSIKILHKPKRPSIGAIDGLPTTGGPSNHSR